MESCNDLFDEGVPGPSNAALDIDLREENDSESDIDVSIIVNEEDNIVDIDMESDVDDNNDEGGNLVEGLADGLWSEICVEIEVTPFNEQCGPIHDLPVGAGPLDYFLLLMPPTFFEEIARQTNLYAAQCQVNKNKQDKYWKEVTSGDIKVYIAMNILYGIHSIPHLNMYWCIDDRLHVPGVADVMSKSRYEKISQYLHMNDSSNFVPMGQPGFDPLFKVRPFLNIVLDRIAHHYKPGVNISIDEAMIAFTGRLYFKQFIRTEPNPWGIKVWCAADADTGYLLNFDIYTGKSREVAEYGEGHHVVTTLGRPFLNKWHHFYFDNLFTSIQLAQDLLQLNTYCCGTIRPNRKKWPSSLKPIRTKALKKGEARNLQSGNLLATAWKDKRVVHVLSTNSNVGTVTVSRNTPMGRTNAILPTSVHNYNCGMGGVDMYDQFCSYYDFGRKSRKWWRYIFRFLVQVCLVNSWLLYKNSIRPHQKNLKNVQQVYFRLDVAERLVLGNISKQRSVSRSPSSVGSATTNQNEHQQIRMYGRKHACHYCSKTKNFGRRGRAPETVFGCNLCNIRLCKGLCFAKFHDQLK